LLNFQSPRKLDWGDLSSKPGANSAEVVFPHLVDLGGYTTEFVLYSGVAGQASGGSVSFYTQTGTPLLLNLN